MLCVDAQMTGHTVHIDILTRMDLAECKERLQKLIANFRDLKLDQNEYTCLKFLILLNPGTNRALPLLRRVA